MSRGLAATVLLALASCTFSVSLTAQAPERPEVVRSQVPLVLLAPDELTSRQIDIDNLFMVGFIHSWRYGLGAEVASGSEAVARQFFEQVTPAAERPAEDGVRRLVLEPGIRYFDVDPVSLSSRVVLTYRLTDGEGRLLHESEVRGTSSFGWHQGICIVAGFLYGKPALRHSASDALDAAYAKLADQLGALSAAGELEQPAQARRPGPAPASQPR